MEKKKIVIASSNADKVKEIKLALSDFPLEFLDLKQFGSLPEATEDGQTFAANAESKARHYRRLTQLPCLADDSGLMVEALNGAPGVHSARFAGFHADDATNNAKLVSELKKIGCDKSPAKYVCALVLIGEDEKLLTSVGEMHGEIRLTPRGAGGFGYDPYFYLSDGRTLAEISRQEKNSLSHRGQALRRLATQLTA